MDQRGTAHRRDAVPPRIQVRLRAWYKKMDAKLEALGHISESLISGQLSLIHDTFDGGEFRE